jgi:hypothetical protein
MKKIFSNIRPNSSIYLYYNDLFIIEIKTTMSNNRSELVCNCRGCDHQFGEECLDAKCECCSLEDHVKGTNVEDATQVFPGGSI